MKKKMLLIDVYNTKVDTVEVGCLEDYYAALGCSCITIVRRRIDGKPFEIICDDEGLLVSNPKVSALDSALEGMLVGNLLIASGEVTENGDLTSIKDDELATVFKNIRRASTNAYPQPYHMVTNMSY